jgi:putative ABC transport system permease protein
MRLLAKSQGFTAVAVITLALGIGANTAIFSVIDTLILRPLPYKQPDHLVMIWGNFAGIRLPNNQNAISAPELKDLESQNKCFSHVAAISGVSFNLKLGDFPQRVEGALVSPALFPLLGVQPALGRVFLPADGEPGKDNVVLISYGLWKRSFGGDPGVVGRRLNINGISREVVGVMPAGFQSYGVDMAAPLVFGPNDLSPEKRADHGLLVLARIKPELSLEQARADMRSLTKAVENQNPGYPYANFQFGFVLTPLLDEMVGDVQKPLWILAGAVALVLLIACVNVANLLLVRSSVREREVATRMALGANRARLFRQWLTESVVLSAMGGLAGLIVAQGGLKLLVRVSATVLPRVADAALDGRVLAFTALVSLVTGILFGLAPGLHMVRGTKAEALRGADRSLAPGSVSQRLRHSLIVVELAMSLVLLCGAGLLVRSFLHVLAVDGGFRPENVLTMRVSLPASKYADLKKVRAFYREVQDRITRLPGVKAVGAANVLPLGGNGWSGTTTMDSTAVAPDLTYPEADQCVVTPGYFQAMGIPLLIGRDFDAHDTDQSLAAAIVDETLAKAFWPNENAVGKRLHQGGPGGNPSWATVIGVVRHVRSHTLEAQSRVQVYWPETQKTSPEMSLVIRTKVAPHSLAASVQKEIAVVDPEQPAYNVRTMEEWTQDSLAMRRLGTALLAVFSGVALLLAAVGIYGVMAYWVGQRTHEIGLRVALGARQQDVLGLVMSRGLRLGVAGLGLGLAGAFALTRVLSSLLYSVRSADPVTFFAVSSTLLGVTLLACYIPARRAMRVDPVVALRHE